MFRAAVAVMTLLLVLSGANAWGKGSAVATSGPVSQTRSDADAAFQAALTDLDGVPDSACTNHMPPPGANVCVSPSGFSPGGMATFSACSNPDVQCAFVVFGREAGADWGLWFEGGAYSALIVSLPAQGLVCAHGGLVLRSEPSTQSDRLAVLPDESIVNVDQFQLNRPATTMRAFGRGWYHVSGPQAGWVAAGFLIAGDSPTCQAAAPAG